MTRRTLTAALVLPLLAFGCSEADPEDPAAPQAGGGDGLATVTGALGSLPPGDDDEQSTIVWGDLTVAAELAGVEPPADPADQQAVTDYLVATTGGPMDDGAASPVVALPPDAAHAERSGQVDEFADEVGWNITEVDRFVERLTQPEVVTVMEGRFDEDALDAALGEPEDGTWQVGDDSGAIDVQDASPARPLGEALWLRLGDDTLTVSRTNDATGEVRDARAGDGPSAANDEKLAGLAGALDSADAYAAMLVSPAPEPDQRGPSPGAAADACLPETTTAVGTGVTDDGGPVILAALAQDSAEAAEANAAALEQHVTDGSSARTGQPWSEIVTVDDVTADGTVVLARLRPVEDQRTALWYDLVTNSDPLISSC